MHSFYKLYSQTTDSRCPDDVFDPLESLRLRCSTCKQCTLPRPRSEDNKVVLGVGSLHPKIMFIGDEPSQYDTGTGVPFSDNLGQVVHRIARRLGVTDRMYITNTRLCHGGDAATCKNYLAEEVMIVNPSCIICFGKDTALNLGKLAVQNPRENEFQYGKRLIIGLNKYYPIYIMHDIRTLFFLPQNKLQEIKDVVKFIARDMDEVI